MTQPSETPSMDYDPARDIDPELHPYLLHPRLQKDCVLLGSFALCDLLLMNDATYPWFILVPRLADISELYHLSLADQNQLMLESSVLSSNLADIFNAHKLNVAAIGNVVRQLHLHHVVRYPDDPAWPAPVWGVLPAKPYSAEQIADLKDRINALLRDCADYQPEDAG